MHGNFPKLSASKLIGMMFTVLLGLGGELNARIDLDGNGFSDLWELRFPGITLDTSDADGDGTSNADEAISGTDPTDASSYLRVTSMIVTSVTLEALNLKIQWLGVGGQHYTLQYWDLDAGNWESFASAPPMPFSGIREIEVAAPVDATLIRIVTREADLDGDGVTGWEETLLGWDDTSGTSNGAAGAGDFEALLRELESENGLALADGSNLPQRLPTHNEATRFLVQATFGPNEASVAEVMNEGIVRWMDSQMAMTPTKTATVMFQNGQPFSALIWQPGWWKTMMIADDQLQQRMAYALSQIFVINAEAGTVIGDNAIVHARYYDSLAEKGMGRYRDLLEYVAYSPQMGFYLSHLKNRKADPEVNRFPDENFAREIMQLFSVGLWELHPDGTRKTDEGEFIPTYDNSTIVEMAKVFTGLSFGSDGGQPNDDFFFVGRGNDYTKPMKVFDEEHEPGAKTIISGIVLPEGQSGEEDVQMALDALANHSNAAPFIGQLLIQRFTSSNPSPEYVTRVTNAWMGSAPSEQGHLGRVLRAILLDPEARTPWIEDGKRGKVREPLLRMTQFLRTYDYKNPNGNFNTSSSLLRNTLGQFPMQAPTVFNFYLPDHSPAGELRAADLASPELEIATTSRLIETDNFFRNMAVNGFFTAIETYPYEQSISSDADALLDHLDELLTWGQMSDSTKAAIKPAVEAQSAPWDKVWTALHLILTSPDYTVLR